MSYGRLAKWLARGCGQLFLCLTGPFACLPELAGRVVAKANEEFIRCWSTQIP
jgi:hypothetical protein